MGCPLITQKSIHQCMYEQKLSEAREENQLKQLEGTMPAAHSGPRIVPAPTSHTGNTHN